jgi:hypothetical protein
MRSCSAGARTPLSSWSEARAPFLPLHGLDQLRLGREFQDERGLVYHSWTPMIFNFNLFSLNKKNLKLKKRLSLPRSLGLKHRQNVNDNVHPRPTFEIHPSKTSTWSTIPILPSFPGSKIFTFQKSNMRR